ncbi:MAG TPA: pilus (MSHA type) biogenesis protein MshL [Azospira sp.]|nr:pilus (MSHA type) biogenesis protein MshL [Azospira sp.]
MKPQLFGRTALCPTLAMTLAGSLAACAITPVQAPSNSHLQADSAAEVGGHIPAPVQQTIALPRPKAAAKAETYSVVVNNVKVHELLFALARDAKLNVDIHGGISGNVTLNAIDQTLPQLLNRIAKQVDMRFELDGPNLAVMPDVPYLKTYKVDYVNVSREVSSTIASNNRVTSGSAGIANNTNSTGGGNISTTRIENSTKNRFWETLDKNIKDLLRETDKILPEGSSETVVEQASSQSTTGTGAMPPTQTQRGSPPNNLAASPNPAALQNAGTTVVRRTTFREAASVIANPETGVLSVRATSRQHEKVQEYLTHIMASARRQVLIEATIVEVALADTYKQGIDWKRLRSDGSGFTLSGTSVGKQAVENVTPFVITNVDKRQPLNLDLTLKLLQTFGNVKVLSSPKMSVLNNQTAMLRVVEDFVYFKVDSNQTATTNAGVQTSVNTTPQTVSIGLTMTVTPQVSDNDTVILDVRPTVTSIAALAPDPNPLLTIPNNVPQLRTREIESVMRIASGDVAVLGGLMEDSIDYKTNRIPLLGQIPLFGEIFTNRDNVTRKTELVIFLRPIVIRDASIVGDYAGFREQLPQGNFFATPPGYPQAMPFVFGDNRP